jgi:hypothetical protein
MTWAETVVARAARRDTFSITAGNPFVAAALREACDADFPTSAKTSGFEC